MTERTQHAPLSQESAVGLQVTLQPARAYRHVETIVLRQGLYDVGAAVDADVVLPVGGVQRQHCRIEVDDEVATLTADSRMTWINDQPVDCRDLCDGDRLAIGPIEFTVGISRANSSSAAVAHPQTIERQELDELLSSSSDGNDDAPHDAAPAASEGVETAVELAAVRQQLAEHEAKLTLTEQLVVDLEQRRDQLQSVVDDLVNDAARQHEQQEQQERRHREHVARLENDATIWRAALAEREQDVHQFRGDLERRFSALQQVEAEIYSQSEEFKRESEELAHQQRDQYERESLLQSRLDEVGHAEATFNEREAELSRRAGELEQRAADLSRQSEELQQQSLQLEQHRCDAEAAVQAGAEEDSRQEFEQARLREQLSACEEELTRLRAQLADGESAETERELQLREREAEVEDLTAQVQSQFDDIEQREIELETAHSGLDSRRRDLEDQQALLDEQRQSLEQGRSQFALDNEAFEVEREALTAQRRQIECQLQQVQESADVSAQAAELAADRERLQQERDELHRERESHQHELRELNTQRQSIETQRQECERLRRDLEIEHQALKGAGDDADLRRQQFAARADELQVRSDELQQRLAEIKARRAELRQQAVDVRHALEVEADSNTRAERESELAAREAELQRRETDAAQRHSELSAVKVELRDFAGELNTRLQQVEQRETALSKSQQSVAVRDADVHSAWAEIAESRSQLDRQREEFGAKLESFSRDHKTLREDQEAMDVLRKNLQEKQRELDDERRRCREQLANVDVAEQKQEAELRAFAATRDGWHRERATLVAQIGHLSAKHENAHGHQPDAPDGSCASRAPHFGPNETADRFSIEADEDEHVEDEIVDVAATDDVLPEAVLKLRSQMAAMFGMQSRPRTPSAAPCRPEDVPQAEVSRREIPVSPADGGTESAEVQEEHSHPHTNDRQPSGSTSDIDEAAQVRVGERGTRSDDARDEVSQRSDDTSVEVATLPDDAVIEAANARQQAKRDSDLERQKLNSLRELANLSARSALARHASTELKNTLLVQGIITGLCVSGTIVLLASPVWSNTSRMHWGIGAALVSGVMIWKTLQTTSRMQNNRAVGKSLTNGRQETAVASVAPSDVVETTKPEATSQCT